MLQMKYIAKYLFYHIICPLLLFLGVGKLLRNRSSNRRLIVMYHGVSGGKNFSINGRHLPVNEFENHLKYYKKNFAISSLKDLCDKRNVQDQKTHLIAITFDDGYLNNIQHAIPLLLKYQIPATFFVSTICLTEREYLHPADYIDIIRRSTSESVEINGIVFYNRNSPFVNSNNNAYNYMNSLNLRELKGSLVGLQKKYPFKNVLAGIDPTVYSLVSPETISGFVSENLFTIGSHSHDHVNLTMLSKEELNHQLRISKGILEMHTQSNIDSIAFPYGYFNKEVVDSCSQEGYKYLIAGGSITDVWKHRVFPRIGILNMAGFSFNMLSINRGFRNFGF